MSQPDCRNRARGVWLVKVPKYLSQRWLRQAGSSEVGRLRITKPKTPKDKTEVVFHLSGEKDISDQEVPEEHRFVIGSLNSQTLAVLSESKDVDDMDVDQPASKLVFEGRVVQRAECRPPASDNYMDMKKHHIEQVSKPTIQIKTIDKAEVKFKPVARHAEQAQADKAKKEGKNVRLDKQAVLDLLFGAFEKHQFYKLVDLARVTAQPPNYLKDILQEIAVYNTQAPHKYTWELKPEYSHYKSEETVNDA